MEIFIGRTLKHHQKQRFDSSCRNFNPTLTVYSFSPSQPSGTIVQTSRPFSHYSFSDVGSEETYNTCLAGHMTQSAYNIQAFGIKIIHFFVFLTTLNLTRWTFLVTSLLLLICNFISRHCVTTSPLSSHIYTTFSFLPFPLSPFILSFWFSFFFRLVTRK
ncbi:hypothetical protein BGX38DRAFT_748371 [Terfezia claveryi]|nr:hypothetical protein BGX38DRAFT_748371 [Terfezia claveryi]